MNTLSPDAKEDLQKRLRRIAGQARGVEKMVADDRDCREIIQQLNSIQSAVRNASAEFMRAYAKECLLPESDVDLAARAALVDDLFNLLSKVK